MYVLTPGGPALRKGGQQRNRESESGSGDEARRLVQEAAATLHGGGGEEDGAVVFVLEDGSRHKSPSAAGSKVMGGKAVNGWRFWSLEGEAPAAPAEGAEKPAKTKSRSKSKKKEKVVFKTPQVNMPAGKVHYFCSACMKGFDVEGDEEPEAALGPPQRRPGAQRAGRHHRRRRGGGDGVIRALATRAGQGGEERARSRTKISEHGFARRSTPC